MIRAAIAFFILGLVAFLFGANNIAGVSLEIGRLLLIVFVIIAVIAFVASLTTGKSTKLP